MAQDRRVTRTKNALTKALFQMLGEKEFSKISITELARRADVDRKTFYLHYQSPNEILEEFYAEQLDKLETAILRENVFGQRVDIPGFFRVLNSVINENLELYRLLVKGPTYSSFETKLQDMMRREVEEQLSRRAGHLQPQEARLYSIFFASAVLAVYRDWLKGDLQVEEDRLAQMVGQTVSDGLRRAAYGQTEGIPV